MLFQEHQLEGITQTQRDLYYQVKSDLFPTPLVVSNTLKDVSGILGAPREDLNITTFSGKGKVAGSLRIYHPRSGQWQDCRKSVFSVPGDLNEIRCCVWRRNCPERTSALQRDATARQNKRAEELI